MRATTTGIARRLVAGALAAGLVTGCAQHPRAVMTVGAVFTAGAVASFYQGSKGPREAPPAREPPGPLAFGPLDPGLLYAMVGAVLGGIGLGLIAGGAAHLDGDAPRGTPPTGPARAELAQRSEELEHQLRVDAADGRCQAAAGSARRLSTLDHPRLQAMIAGDPAVARCLVR